MEFLFNSSFCSSSVSALVYIYIISILSIGPLNYFLKIRYKFKEDI